MPKRQTIPQKILNLLSDGLPHKVSDVHALLYDDQGKQSNIHPHLSKARESLIPKGKTIICQMVGYIRHYRITCICCVKDSESSLGEPQEKSAS